MPVSQLYRSPSPDRGFSRTLLLATDLQQSILAELDRSGPNQLTYTAYGSQSSRLPAGTRLGFNGQLKEHPTGWYHLGNGHRVYNPVLMRFHSPDRLSPFGKGGMNSYVYCGGSPVNRVDPTGKWWFAIPVAGQAVGTALGAVFAVGATFRTAVAKYFTKTPLPANLQTANRRQFWGGVIGILSRPLGIPGALAAALPPTNAALSVGGNLVSQVLTFSGGLEQALHQGRQLVDVSRATGPSIPRMAFESVKEVSGANAVTAFVKRRFTRASEIGPDVPMVSFQVDARTVRDPDSLGSQEMSQFYGS
ncbi:RHS repeat-associated core domain-containing protein [Pseudomonas sp. WJP1]|uniref:RHS repeat-associated core domain-containing protein n=1 Tax=Pseudomonas sp. WJP1 TaxID=2986947 RepID=UPI00234B1E39|nr:RHS repeat-associated core domain-containing protein [Pseudomonas sp. WJP1]WCM51020.1 RHS repeat-associated core domain-containing protein [Pseudomonas sp. WJP1]